MVLIAFIMTALPVKQSYLIDTNVSILWGEETEE